MSEELVNQIVKIAAAVFELPDSEVRNGFSNLIVDELERHSLVSALEDELNIEIDDEADFASLDGLVELINFASKGGARSGLELDREPSSGAEA